MIEVTRDKVNKARQALNKAITAEEWLEALVACGVECTEEIERCRHMKEFATKYLQLFGNQFPTQSP